MSANVKGSSGTTKRGPDGGVTFTTSSFSFSFSFSFFAALSFLLPATAFMNESYSSDKDDEAVAAAVAAGRAATDCGFHEFVISIMSAGVPDRSISTVGLLSDAVEAEAEADEE